MSTTTTNYGLVKPELTDAADITAMNENWDKIDEELKEHADHTHTASDVGARPDTWMPTASQVGALSDKGGTLSGNLKLLRGNSPTIEMKVLSDNGYTSMYQHGGTFTTSSGMSSDSDESFMVLTKPSEDDDSSIFRIGRTINNSSKYYKLYGEHNPPTASDVGASPTNHSHYGTNISPNAIEFNGANAHGGYLDFHYGESTDDYTLRLIENERGVLSVLLPDDATHYPLFGEHNTELLASTIQSLIESGAIEVGGFKSPVRATSTILTASEGGSFTGTGKGQLFISMISSSSSDVSGDITVDGVLLGQLMMSQYSGYLSIDFTESFTVQGGQKSQYCVAVFY